MAHTVGVLFSWADEEPQQTIQTQLEGIAPTNRELFINVSYLVYYL